MAVVCTPGMQNFVGDIVAHLSRGYDVRTGFDGDNRTLNELVAWADIIWLEWANELAMAVSQGLPLHADKRVICRLHSYEAFAPFLTQMRWSRIDDLIFVAPHIRDYVLQLFPDLPSKVKRIHLVPNGIDLDRFPLTVRTAGPNLAFLGYINYKKGPMLLLHAFAELVRREPRHCLFIGGSFQDDRYRLYFDQMTAEMGLTGRIRFDGWISDVSGWLADKHYIVGTSVLEAHPVGIMEAMACGVKPVIHNFVGARGVFDSRYVWNTIDEFVAMIRSEEYDSGSYREFVERNYSLNRQLARIDEFLAPVTVSV